jgi:hypothetical protein
MVEIASGIRKRILAYALVPYVIAIVVWKFALGKGWLESLLAGPLGIFIAGVILSFLYFYAEKRRNR